MLSIYEIHEKANVSIRALRRLERLGVLKISATENAELARMENTLKKGNPLTALQRAHLIENPDVIFELRHFAEAQKQIEELGDAKAEAPKPAIGSVIDFASRGQPKEVDVLAAWMKRVIPADRDVSYYHVAVRALLGVSGEGARKYVAGRLPRAFLNVRGMPDFAGWFSFRTAPHGRNATYYHRPKQRFDL